MFFIIGSVRPEQTGLLGLRMKAVAVLRFGECAGWVAHLQCADQDVAPLQLHAHAVYKAVLHASPPGLEVLAAPATRARGSQLTNPSPSFTLAERRKMLHMFLQVFWRNPL